MGIKSRLAVLSVAFLLGTSALLYPLYFPQKVHEYKIVFYSGTQVDDITWSGTSAELKDGCVTVFGPAPGQVFAVCHIIGFARLD